MGYPVAINSVHSRPARVSSEAVDAFTADNLPTVHLARRLDAIGSVPKSQGLSKHLRTWAITTLLAAAFYAI